MPDRGRYRQGAADQPLRPTEARQQATRAPRAFRGDVEGLRAIAVGLVLLYHAGVPFMSGGFVGVDIFFVISGFLITSQLINELDRTGTVSLVRFYARRAKRLLPATVVVLMVTAVLVALVFSRVRWREAGGDIVASSVYVLNWRLADRSVDYLAEDSGASPVQHFWSLAVEEQFYLIWPLLILLCAWVARRWGLRLRHALAVGLAAVAVPSFVWSVVATSSAPASAFFVTTTRLWELAIGAGVALGAGLWARFRPEVGRLVAWAGLAVLLLSGLALSTSVPWPGSAALLPTLGTAAVIVGGFTAGETGPTRVIGTAGFRWVGALSYSLYLWHWPLLVVAEEHFGGLSLPMGLGIAAFSVVPAWLTYRFIENPIRHSEAISTSPRLALSLGANCTLIGVVVGAVLMAAVPSTAAPSAAQQPPPGAEALAEEAQPDDPLASLADVGTIVPAPAAAVEDVPALYDDGCQVDQDVSEPEVCVYGDEDSDTVVALVGDSKIAQYADAIGDLGAEKGWRVVTITKSACPFTAAVPIVDDEPYTTCAEWNDRVAELLAGEVDADLVLTSQRGSTATADGEGERSEDAMVEGLRETWGTLVDAGIGVGVVLDNPAPEEVVYECVADSPDELASCAFDRDAGVADSAAGVQARAADGMDGVDVIDVTDAICSGDTCLPVVGDVLVYRQGTHLTRTYAETMIPVFDERISPLLER